MSYFTQIPRWTQGKTRLWSGWAFALLLGWSSRDFPHWGGVGVCFLGAVLRCWASGYLRKDQRLAVGGPYAWTRNPLYLGTYLMAVGILGATQQWLLFFAMTLFFAGIYHFVILEEERRLERLFGTPYLFYCQGVPRFFPSYRGPASPQLLRQVNRSAVGEPYSWKGAWENKAYEAFLAFLGLVGWSTGCAWVWKTWMSG